MISFSEVENVLVEIYDMQGKLVYSNIINNSLMHVELNNKIPAGIYSIQFKTADAIISRLVAIE